MWSKIQTEIGGKLNVRQLNVGQLIVGQMNCRTVERVHLFDSSFVGQVIGHLRNGLRSHFRSVGMWRWPKSMCYFNDIFKI